MTDATLLERLVAGPTTRREEAQILALLRVASADNLDQILASTDIAALLNSVDDHLFGPANRQQARDLLVERLGDLGVEARANLAYGLQAGGTSEADAEAIRAVLTSAHGEQLTRLKNAMNMRIDRHDLEGLVFGDIRQPGIRQDILAHIADQAAAVTPGEAKILCDIDDTVMASLHDRRFPRGTVYPGILAFLDALDRGPEDEPYSLGDLTFVTARPSDAFGVIANHTRGSLRRAGVANHSVLTGSVIHLLTHDLMAGRKIAKIEHYHALFPEYPLLFIGDSGQGDIRVGELLWERFATVLDLVVIHDVVGLPQQDRDRLRSHRIHVVDTYVGAAQLAWDRGLIAAEGRDRTVTEARAALASISWDSPEQQQTTERLIARDLAVVEASSDR